MIDFKELAHVIVEAASQTTAEKAGRLETQGKADTAA